MRATILFAIFILLLSGCDEGQTSIELLSPTFTLTDTSGHQTSVFRSGQDFEMTFVVRNSTRKGPDTLSWRFQSRCHLHHYPQ